MDVLDNRTCYATDPDERGRKENLNTALPAALRAADDGRRTRSFLVCFSLGTYSCEQTSARRPGAAGRRQTDFSWCRGEQLVGGSRVEFDSVIERFDIYRWFHQGQVERFCLRTRVTCTCLLWSWNYHTSTHPSALQSLQHLSEQHLSSSTDG